MTLLDYIHDRLQQNFGDKAEIIVENLSRQPLLDDIDTTDDNTDDTTDVDTTILVF